jgi:hypothetical protein
MLHGDTGYPATLEEEFSRTAWRCVRAGNAKSRGAAEGSGSAKGLDRAAKLSKDLLRRSARVLPR